MLRWGYPTWLVNRAHLLDHDNEEATGVLALVLLALNACESYLAKHSLAALNDFYPFTRQMFTECLQYAQRPSYQYRFPTSLLSLEARNAK